MTVSEKGYPTSNIQLRQLVKRLVKENEELTARVSRLEEFTGELQAKITELEFKLKEVRSFIRSDLLVEDPGISDSLID